MSELPKMIRLQDFLHRWDLQSCQRSQNVTDLTLKFESELPSIEGALNHRVNAAYLATAVVFAFQRAGTPRSLDFDPHKPYVGNMEIPLPPLEDQRKLVEVLKTLWRAMENARAQLDTMKELEQCLFWNWHGRKSGE